MAWSKDRVSIRDEGMDEGELTFLCLLLHLLSSFLRLFLRLLLSVSQVV